MGYVTTKFCQLTRKKRTGSLASCQVACTSSVCVASGDGGIAAKALCLKKTGNLTGILFLALQSNVHCKCTKYFTLYTTISSVSV